MSQTIAFQAYANFNRVTRDTPRQAAIAFFEAFPNKRKCRVTEGLAGDGFFTITYNLRADGKRPQSWQEVTKKTAATLPDTVQP